MRKRKDADMYVFPLSIVRGTGVFQAQGPQMGFCGSGEEGIRVVWRKMGGMWSLSEISGHICQESRQRLFMGRDFLPGNYGNTRSREGNGKYYQFSIIIQAGAGCQPRPLTLLVSSIGTYSSFNAFRHLGHTFFSLNTVISLVMLQKIQLGLYFLRITDEPST